jgi:hypothetical protein
LHQPSSQQIFQQPINQKHNKETIQQTKKNPSNLPFSAQTAIKCQTSISKIFKQIGILIPFLIEILKITWIFRENFLPFPDVFNILSTSNVCLPFIPPNLLLSYYLPQFHIYLRTLHYKRIAGNPFSCEWLVKDALTSKNIRLGRKNYVVSSKHDVLKVAGIECFEDNRANVQRLIVVEATHEADSEVVVSCLLYL